MSTPILHPLTVGDILDQTFSLYRRNFALLIGIVALVQAPLLALSLGASALSLPNTPLFEDDLTAREVLYSLGGALTLLVTLVGAAVWVLQVAALSYAFSERAFGRALTLKQAYLQTLRRVTALLVASIILGVINGFFIFCGAFCLLVPGLILLAPLDTRWLFTFPVIMLEERDGIESMRRSWRLVRGYFWRTFGVALALVLLYYALSLGPTYLLIFLAFSLSGAEWLLLVSGAMGGIVGALLLPISVGAVTLMYYDLRVREEGLDLQMRLAAQQLAPTLGDQSA